MWLSSKIQTRREGDTFTYVLPRRELGSFHFVGVAIVALGILALAFIAGIWWFFVKPRGPVDAFTIGFGLFISAILFGSVLGTLNVIRFGLFVIAGHTEVTLSPARVSICERLGPIFRRRSRKVEDFRRVNVIYGDGVMRVNGKPSDKFRELAKTSGLGLDGEGAKPMMLALAYPKPMLIGLGEDIARRLKLEFRAGDKDEMADVIDAMKAENTSG
jgi:hypothetical protein